MAPGEFKALPGRSFEGARVAYNNPSVADFQGYFFRDFPYGTDVETQVLDADITKAFQLTNAAINQGLWPDQATYSVAYYYLTAHYLVVALRASSQGLSGQFSFLESSKSVGSVSQSFSIPQRILDDPNFAMLMTTNYGAQYMQLIMPRILGVAFIAYGSTRP